MGLGLRMNELLFGWLGALLSTHSSLTSGGFHSLPAACGLQASRTQLLVFVLMETYRGFLSSQLVILAGVSSFPASVHRSWGSDGCCVSSSHLPGLVAVLALMPVLRFLCALTTGMRMSWPLCSPLSCVASLPLTNGPPCGPCLPGLRF